ncbi:MAG TPA: V-type ATP synthase subunit F [Conexivisphaerales archaeon]|nr:V-type ATP synthase subunit F [Conexivisphaerales archaeon]
MKVVAVGKRPFVTAFRLVGVGGVEVDSSAEMLSEVDKLFRTEGIGLVLLGSDLSADIRMKLAEYRKKRAVPLIYEIVTPGAKAGETEYSKVLRAMLGV